ncbi:hypothetical protein SESBI_39975 [Sesbania bispinosa]|nr:hypothetical protein SESBI_39975 [Sesbania bispinosa]
MDHHGHGQNPSMGVVGSGPQLTYGSNPYQPNHMTGSPGMVVSSEIEKVTDFKNHSLPLARIKKIMKADEDVRMISAEAPVVFARACEMFILELTLRSWNHTEENKRRTLQKNDIAAAITRTDIFDFLVDIVPREDLKDEVLASIPRGTMPVAGPADALPYCYMPPQHAQQVGNAGVMMPKPMMDPNIYAQQPHPYMAPQMWPQPPEQQQSSPDH